MADYLHGAYGQINVAGNKAALKSNSAFVYVGTAPVHLVKGGAGNVNKPVVVNNIAEAKSLFGYSDDFAKYTLCEAMKVHLIDNGVSPIIMINVLDTTVHIATEGGSKTETPANGRITITDAEDLCVDTLTVKRGSTSLVYGTDYTVAYNENNKTISIVEVSSGSLGSSELTMTWTKVDATKVDATAVIGSTNNYGTNTGIYAVKDVYQVTGMIPSYILAPGFSSVKSVHTVMRNVARKVNGHWDAYILADLPLTNDSGTALTISTANNWKNTNGYNGDNETVYFPMAIGLDDKHYHLSVLAAANLQTTLLDQDGIPYKSASNTEIAIKKLYMGENDASVFDDQIINENLCKNGIASAAYIGGRWVIWGAHTAAYTYAANDSVYISETNTMMMYYLSNDFQNRRAVDVDKPMTVNDLKSIVSEEQSRLDALIGIGALIYGTVMVDASTESGSDVVNGDYKFSFSITTTPLAKSLTAVVTWTDEGFTTYYEAMSE